MVERVTPEERAEKREAVIQGMIARGYDRERAEELVDLIAKTLFGPGGRFATPAAQPEQTEPTAGGGSDG